jgi:prolyl 4-hydroxylase
MAAAVASSASAAPPAISCNSQNDGDEAHHHDARNRDDDDNDSCSSTSSVNSVDTHEALFSMLGLTSDGFEGFRDLENVDDTDDQDVQQLDTECCMYPKIKRHMIITVPSRCSRYLHPPEKCLAFMIDNFCSKLECEQLIRRAGTHSRQGFQYVTEAAHVAPDGASYTVKLQNPNPHKLSVFDHPPTISRLWKKLDGMIRPIIQPYIERENCGPPLGLNPRLRVLRYDSTDDDRFESHFDATTQVGFKTRSHLTVLLYLNDGGGKDFDGGETLYLNSHISSKKQIEKILLSTESHTKEEEDSKRNMTKIIPETGKVVIFEHDLFHSGAPLISGTKYVLRTDILFAVNDDDHVDENKNNTATSIEKLSADHDGHDDYEHAHEEAGASSSSSPTTLLLVSDLCIDLRLSEDIIDLFAGMGMLEMTIDSFVAPGIAMLKAMLLDEILDATLVDRIVTKAFKLSKM